MEILKAEEKQHLQPFMQPEGLILRFMEMIHSLVFIRSKELMPIACCLTIPSVEFQTTNLKGEQSFHFAIHSQL